MALIGLGTGLTARIIVSFAVLTMLYLVFLSVLVYVGINFIAIAVIASLMILAQWYFSDKEAPLGHSLIVLWSTGAQIVRDCAEFVVGENFVF